MKLGRPRPPDEEVDVFLVDTPPTGSTTTVTLGEDTRRRRRWPELGLVVVGVAVVIGLGLFGGGDDDVEAAPDPTTTVKPRPATSRPRRTTTTQPGRFTTTTARRTTTTTTWPQVTAGTGPMLPTRTHTVIGALGNDGIITMVDLDTGNRCRTQLDRAGSWIPWQTQAVPGPLIVQVGNGQQLYAVDGMCAARPIDIDINNGWIATTGPEALWLAPGQQTHFEEISTTTYTPTGRTVDVPSGSLAVTIVAVGRDVAVSAAGELTLIDPDTGSRRAIGTGYPLAAFERTLAVVSCPALECALVLVDVDTGHRTVFGNVVPSTWPPAMFSSDGRRLLVGIPGDHPDWPDTAVVDVTNGRVTNAGANIQGAVFTNDGRWLVTNKDDRIGAVALDGSGVAVVFSERDAITNVQALAVVR